MTLWTTKSEAAHGLKRRVEQTQWQWQKKAMKRDMDYMTKGPSLTGNPLQPLAMNLTGQR
eukprot:10508626-Prorocentrum_lima.AAC.1